MPSQIPSVEQSEQHEEMETQNPPLNLVRSRRYQTEMYEASMKGNIIVVVRLFMGLYNEPL